MRLEIDNAEESLLKVAKSHGNSGMVSVPKGWVGREVRVVLLEKEDLEDKIQEFLIEYNKLTVYIQVDWTDGDILFYNFKDGEWVEHPDQIELPVFKDESLKKLYAAFLERIFGNDHLLDMLAGMSVGESFMLGNTKYTRMKIGYVERFDKGKLTMKEHILMRYGEEKWDEMKERLSEKNKYQRKFSKIIKTIKEEPNVRFVTQTPAANVLEVCLYHSVDLDTDKINRKLKHLDVEVLAKPGYPDESLPETHFIIPLLIKDL